MHNWSINLIWVFSISILISCNESRKLYPPVPSKTDLSGHYKSILQEKNFFQVKLKIENEDGPADIMVILERVSPLSTKEKKIMKDHYFLPKTMEEIFVNPIVLGQGPPPAIIGGENITQDAGLSSEFYVCSKTFNQPGMKSGNIATVRYCLKGIKQKEEDHLKGMLDLYVTYRVKLKGRSKFESGSDALSIPFTFQTSETFDDSLSEDKPSFQ